MLRVLREELRHCTGFTFSVAFVTPRAIALLKQELVEFRGEGRIVTSDYLGFNSPAAFAELHNLGRLGVDVRLHPSPAYHPKGYVFTFADSTTAILGSSNLTESALTQNYEWNLKVSASRGSDLASQLDRVLSDQLSESRPITLEWIADYKRAYDAVPPRANDFGRVVPMPDEFRLPGGRLTTVTDLHHGPVEVRQSEAQGEGEVGGALRGSLPQGRGAARGSAIEANGMQREALIALTDLRSEGASKGVVISATGTGKTILSALDVRAVAPDRMLFVVHREQILDRAIEEFRRVLGADAGDFGKLAGSTRQTDRKYLFATIQTLSQSDVLADIDPAAFDYILIDEVHRAGAASYLKIVEHFRPQFLLGMTATPERSDGFNVFQLFDYNVPYEIRLGRALEADMLSPFHYYGIADATFDDGTTTDVETGLARLVSRVRAAHIVDAIEIYGQAGIEPCGLIFCSRKAEAVGLSDELNRTAFRGRLLRTRALTGEDSIPVREEVVERLEQGDLDYVLTVDVFNEGVDIPAVNQVVLLRQTQSSIVFVQQLGRGLRKHPGKGYLVVIDFIGNYANNYLIPIALFGDDSLNKESVRKSLLAAEESGVIAGLSSVRFDRVSQQRVLGAITATKLDSLHNLKAAIATLQARLGTLPQLQDFLRFESADPVLLATALGSYPALLERLFKVDPGLSDDERGALEFLSQEVLASKRLHELVVLKALLRGGRTSKRDLAVAFDEAGIASNASLVESVLRVFSLDFHTEQEQARYERGIVSVEGDVVELAHDFQQSYRASVAFKSAVDDLIETGDRVTPARYDGMTPFTPGRQYSRKDACRLLGWAKNVQSTIYGYRVDGATDTCPVFVTHHKSDAVSASTAYEDELVDRSTMIWYTRSRRTLESKEVHAIVSNRVRTFVFAKKDDAEGSDFYFLGEARAGDATQTTMLGDAGVPLDVVRMTLTFDKPIDASVFDYLHPVVMS
jgi:superfamily II DNA or RNA helicase/HKD family nuclease